MISVGEFASVAASVSTSGTTAPTLKAMAHTPQTYDIQRTFHTAFVLEPFGEGPLVRVEERDLERPRLGHDEREAMHRLVLFAGEDLPRQRGGGRGSDSPSRQRRQAG